MTTLDVESFLPMHPEPTWVPEAAFELASAAIKKFPLEEGFLRLDEQEGEYLTFGYEDAVRREAFIRVTWNRFAAGRDPEWFARLSCACYRRYQSMEANKQIEQLVEWAGLPIVHPQKRRIKKVFYETVEMSGFPPHRYQFDCDDLETVEFGARLFLWLAAAYRPLEFGYANSFTTDLEMSPLWVKVGKSEEGPDGARRLLSFSSDPFGAMVLAVRDLTGTSELDSSVVLLGSNSFIPLKKERKYILGGRETPALPTMQWEVLDYVCRASDQRADARDLMKVCGEEKSDFDHARELEPEDCKRWAKGYLSQINENIRPAGHILRRKKHDKQWLVVWLERIDKDASNDEPS